MDVGCALPITTTSKFSNTSKLTFVAISNRADASETSFCSCRRLSDADAWARTTSSTRNAPPASSKIFPSSAACFGAPESSKLCAMMATVFPRRTSKRDCAPPLDSRNYFINYRRLLVTQDSRILPEETWNWDIFRGFGEAAALAISRIFFSILGGGRPNVSVEVEMAWWFLKSTMPQRRTNAINTHRVIVSRERFIAHALQEKTAHTRQNWITQTYISSKWNLWRDVLKAKFKFKIYRYVYSSIFSHCNSQWFVLLLLLLLLL